MSNSFGTIFNLTSFGESHGEMIGGVIDGCPSGITIDFNFIQNELKKRAPFQKFETIRSEEDKVEFISGIFEGKTLGSPIAFIIKNSNKKSSDYDSLKNIFRPSHADFTYQQKYGIRDYRGGGRASARETVVRVVAGAIARLILKKYDIEILGFVKQIGNIALDKDYRELNIREAYSFPTRCPEKNTDKKIQKLLEKTQKENDSLGGIICCVVKNLPAGLGEPIYDKLTARLSYAIMSINATKGIEFGNGFQSSQLKGSENNDVFISSKKQIKTLTNNSGGIQGGISNGEDVYFNVAFKPVASIAQKQNTVDLKGKQTEIEIKGRHDVCIVPRAVPIVEAMTALVITDFLLLQNSKQI